MTSQLMNNFRKILAEQLFASDVGDTPFEATDRGVADCKLFEPAESQGWSGEIPNITMVVDLGERTATMVAHEKVPEDMMFYLLDCFQQSGMGGVHATRDEVRKVNRWLKEKIQDMEANGMIWREDGEWIFEG